MKTPVDYNDAMQIIEDPKAAAWELRDLAKSLLEDFQVARAAERELCMSAVRMELHNNGQAEAICLVIRALGNKP